MKENEKRKPPTLAIWLISKVIDERLLEEFTGDLTEIYEERAATKGEVNAKLMHWVDAIHLLVGFASFKMFSNRPNSTNMLSSYIKIGWRNLLKSKVYSSINISGLAIGLACSIAIGLFIADEHSYDRFHRNAGDIYRVVQRQNQAGELYDVASTPGPMAEALKADFPEVVHSSLLGYTRSGVLQQGQTLVESSSITMADPGFLKMFDFKLRIGNIDKVFTAPNQVVITERMAANLFGNDWASRNGLLGSTIMYHPKTVDELFKSETLLTLAGVVEDPPTNSHLQFEVILTYDPLQGNNKNWFSNNFLTYIQLNSSADPAEFNRKLDGYINKYRSQENLTFDPPVFFLQPLTDIYLHSDFDFQTDWTKTSNIVYVRIFFAVGMIVLMIAVVNFINLSTARATRRAKEVGIRKTVGGHYRQLMIQFLSESLLITTISVVLALVVVALCLPLLNDIASKSLDLPITDPGFIGVVILFIILVSILAGLYPAIYLSSFQPIKVLKGVIHINSGRRFRQVLVVVQFTFSVLLIASSIVIYEQLAFLRDKSLGFDKARLIYLNTEGLEFNKTLLLRQELQTHSAITGASLASNSLIDVINSTVGFEWEGKPPEDKFLITRLNVDPYYLETTGMKLVTGRNFMEGIKGDSGAYIVNMAAAKRMGWTASEALGKSFTLYGTMGTIVGVVEDFHFRPMTVAIEPLVFSYMTNRSYEGIMVKGPDNKQTIAVIEELYKKYQPLTPAQYSFIDQQLENQYLFEQRTAKLVLIFSGLAIFVACLGLYGLAIFTAEKRTKEIGIRKVMGASIANVSVLLSTDFILLVIISIMIASPLGYLLLRSWLNDFTYRITLEWYYFAEAGLLALSIAALTVLYQAINAATMNPVKSLRTE
jgi:ABC-type antimicrobial peptide transport system permease subunit